MLVDSPTGFLRVSLWTLVPISMATAAITFFLVGNIVKTHRMPPLTGNRAMLGAVAVADGEFTGDGERYRGIVRTHGELWKAICPAPVSTGEALEVISRDNLTLLVRSVKPQQPPKAIRTQRQEKSA
jgi:membrane-bound ClpP family serine protease